MKKSKNTSGELEVSGYFETGWRGEGEEDIPQKNNLGGLILIMFFFLTVFFLRITYLQVVRGAYYAEKADHNRIRTLFVDAPRGLIFDRNHKILADNQPKFDLVAVPGLLPTNSSEKGQLFQKINQTISLDQGETNKRLTSEKVDSFLPVVLKEDLNREEALQLERLSIDWPGISVQKRAKRFYPLAEASAHILGYNGKISPEEFKSRSDYLPTDVIGREGVEANYESQLRGTKGGQEFEIDSQGKTQRIVGEKNAVIGQSLVLNIDLDLQKEAYNALKDKVIESGGDGGAVVAIDPRDGGVLALANYPSFDDNEFEKGLSPEKFQEFFGSSSRPMFDRAIAGTYPPGSTFKPLVAIGALDKKVITPSEVINCPDKLQIGQWTFADWKYHGPTDLNKAIAESVNPYFYIIGGGWGDKKGLGPENIKYYATLLGLGQKLGIDIPQEACGLVPDPDWKKATKQESWYVGDTYHLSIGQGDLLVTPLQLADYISALVNGGTLYQPHLVDYIENPDGTVAEKKKPVLLRKNIFSAGDLASVKQAMAMTVSSESGSGRRLQELGQQYGIQIGGKTGTAQNGDGDRYHAWFVGFAPIENPEIVVVALVEKGGEGYQTALPVAERVLAKYLEKR